MKRFLFGWLIEELERINTKLDTIIANMDFSAEDAAVRRMNREVIEAQQHLPPEQKPKTKE